MLSQKIIEVEDLPLRQFVDAGTGQTTEVRVTLSYVVRAYRPL